MKDPPPTPPPPLPLPRPPRLSALTISSTSSSPSSPSIVNRAFPSSLPICLKKTRFVPDLSVCHCCGLGFPSTSQSGGLHLLRSQWRIAILCATCLARISSAELCSYCFAAFSSKPPEQALYCLACLRRVHLACIRREHYRLVPLPSASKAAFTCIDCCFIPKNANSGSANSLDAQPALLENVVRDARADAENKADAAAKSRENVLAKAEAAKHAVKRAQNALRAVLVAGKDIAKRNHSDALPVVRDEDLALQLHLAMNGSRRISRSAKTGSLVKPKKVIGDQMLGKVQFCTEDKSFFDSLQVTDCAQNLFAELNTDANELKQVSDVIGKDGILCAPLKEKQCCSGRGKTLDFDLDEPKAKLLSVYHKRRKNIDDVISLQQCAKDIGGESTTLQEKNTIASDRYMKKYKKRFKIQGSVDENQRITYQQPEASAA